MPTKRVPPVTRGPGEFVVPAGWKLVPEKYTEEWCQAMSKRTSYPQIHKAIEMVLATAPSYPMTDGPAPEAMQAEEKKPWRKPRKRSAE